MQWNGFFATSVELNRSTCFSNGHQSIHYAIIDLNGDAHSIQVTMFIRHAHRIQQV